MSKVGEVIDQHIVPQSYLKGFYNKNGKGLYTLDTKVYLKDKLPYARPKSAASVCYQPHYYTLNESFKKVYPAFANYDPYFLEKRFNKYENILQKIIAQLKPGNSVIDANDARVVLEAILI